MRRLAISRGGTNPTGREHTVRAPLNLLSYGGVVGNWIWSENKEGRLSAFSDREEKSYGYFNSKLKNVTGS